jgi:hypothetical protein
MSGSRASASGSAAPPVGLIAKVHSPGSHNWRVVGDIPVPNGVEFATVRFPLGAHALGWTNAELSADVAGEYGFRWSIPQMFCLDYNGAHPWPSPLAPNSVHTKS